MFTDILLFQECPRSFVTAAFLDIPSNDNCILWKRYNATDAFYPVGVSLTQKVKSDRVSFLYFY
jgi:hypothetical protein